MVGNRTFAFSPPSSLNMFLPSFFLMRVTTGRALVSVCGVCKGGGGTNWGLHIGLPCRHHQDLRACMYSFTGHCIAGAKIVLLLFMNFTFVNKVKRNGGGQGCGLH